ncbi:Detected protein of unknown function [Hibiscus syriacus]|uniref:Integrase catalytic domain-containing protein n=1 Tax=Hibiscus syriacus TaxID=106335 RepID=A0A6A3AGK4_HIBSY|nr:Detected protein of unknown function [Hibiscus syriacus]
MATKFDIEKFNRRNFSLWKLKMKAILRKDGCLAAISERPVDFIDDNKWNEMDGNAMSNFHLALADEVLSSIEEKKTAKEIWDHLTKLYEVTSLHNKIFLKRKLYTLRMSESTSVTEHLNTLNTLFSQLTSLRCTIGEQERVELLLQSLPDSYDQLIINLTNSNVTSIVFDDVAAAVLQEENRRKNKEDRQVNLQQAEALTTMRGRSAERGQSSSHKHGNTANSSDDGDTLLCEASTTVEGGSVYSCNDHALEIIGVGTIKLKMYDGTIKVVRDVRHVKGLKKNLLSYGLLDNNASKIETRKGIMKVFHGALVVLKGEKIAANLYMLKGETLLEAEASVASCSSDSAMLWHQKLGHVSEQGMKVLVEQKLLLVLANVSLTLCEHCITSKQHRLKFNTSNSRGKNVLELVHSDVWQAPVTSLGGAKYFVSFIDDYSRRCWVYPIKKKSDVFSTFKNFKAWVELDSGNKIKCFRTDNGGEYTSEEFDDFYRKDGIKRQFTVANTPQQNGVVERMNITLLERTRVMLRDAGLEKSFWVEAANTACCLVNRAPSTTIELKTPMEMWTGKPANYSNLHVFGSIVYVMYNSQEISKLDLKFRKCKFLGYADGVKGFRLWDLTARDSSEAEPTHDEQEPESSEAPTTRQSDRVRRRPNWHSNYVIEGNVTYCLLTEDDHIEALKAQQAREFEMKNLGSANKILGMQIHRDRSNMKIKLSQKNYLKNILSRFSMQDLGSLMFVMISTKLDIAQAVGVLRFCSIRAFKSQNPDSFAPNLIKRYGPTNIYKIHLFRSPSVIFCSPELCRKVLTDDEHFSLGYPSSAIQLGGKRSLYGVPNSEHLRLLRLISDPINGHRALALYIGHIEVIVIPSLEELATMNRPIKFFTEMKRIILKVTAQVFLGSTKDLILSSMMKYYSCSRVFFSMPIDVRPWFCIPSSTQGRNKGIMDFLMEVENETGDKLEDEHIIDLLLLILFAGHETTAHSVMLALIYLNQHPQILQKAKKEQEEVVERRLSSRNGPTLSKIKQMDYPPKIVVSSSKPCCVDYLKVIDESLRRSNIGFIFFRKAEADVNIKGYTIPKGWKILAWHRAIHMDPNIYPNPNEFIPSRWENQRLKGNAFIPFGAGSRT